MGFELELNAYTDMLIDKYLKDELTFEEIFEKTTKKIEELQKRYAMPFYIR